jgi:hypothetical protein
MENTSATNPNKKKFVESLAAKSYTGPSVVDYLSKSGYDSSLASRNQLASEYGVKDYIPGSAQSNTALMAALRGGNNNVTNPSGTNVPGASDTTTSVSGGTTAPSNPYKQYLQSLFGGDSYKSAFEKYGTDSERLAGIQSEGEAKELEARRLYEETLNRPGGLLSGAQQAAAVQSRLSNQELADLALRESAAARTAGASQNYLQTLLSAGKDLSDLTMEEQKLLQKETPAPFTISPGQGRYEYDETTGEYRQAAYLPPLPKASGVSTVNLTPTDKQGLVAIGMTTKDIAAMEEEINEFGINAVLEGQDDPKVRDAIMKAYGGKVEEESKLTRENVAKFYGLTDDGRKTGLLGLGKTTSQKLDEIMQTIQRYQALGMSDDDIIKLLQQKK